MLLLLSHINEQQDAGYWLLATDCLPRTMYLPFQRGSAVMLLTVNLCLNSNIKLWSVSNEDGQKHLSKVEERKEKKGEERGGEERGGQERRGRRWKSKGRREEGRERD